MWLSPWSIFQTDTFPIKTCQVKGDWWSPWELEFYLLALVFSLLPSLGFLNVDFDTVMNTQYSEERVPNWYILLVKSTCYLTFGIFSDAITRRPWNKLSPSKIDMLVFKDLHRSLSEYCVFIPVSMSIEERYPGPLFSAPPRSDLIRFTSVCAIGIL